MHTRSSGWFWGLLSLWGLAAACAGDGPDPSTASGTGATAGLPNGAGRPPFILQPSVETTPPGPAAPEAESDAPSEEERALLRKIAERKEALAALRAQGRMHETELSALQVELDALQVELNALHLKLAQFQIAGQSTDYSLETAIVLIQEKKYAAAIPLLEQALKTHPTLELIWEALGWSYHSVGRSDDAEKLWQQYLTLRPESPKAHSLLAQLSIQRSDWQAADRYLQGSLALDPDNYDIRYWYAQNLLRLGRLQQAFDLMAKLNEEDRYRFDVKVDLARLCPFLQRYEESADLWTEVVEEIPENLGFRTEYARSLLLVGNLEEADEQARNILAEDPTLWPAMNLRADLAEISQSPELMEQSLLGLIDDAQDEDIRTRLRVRLAARYVALNRMDAARWPLTLALDQYAAALDREPDKVPWLNQYAQIALMAKQPDRVRRAVDRVLKDLNPYNRHALRTRFELEMLLKHFDAAERALDELTDRYLPEDPYLNLLRARLEVQRGNYQNALDALDRLEEAGNQGAVLTLLYHGLTESEWMALTSTRRLEEHLLALKNAGFTFVAPSDIPAYLASPRKGFTRPSPKPWLARQVDSLRYAFTGRREQAVLEDIRPAKVVAITFDDGLRSSFQLGTPIAQELGVPFGMFVLGIIEELNAPMYASWEEIRTYHETGLWEIGSHLMHAHVESPTGPEPEPKVFPLPNRIWNPERNRPETLREWSLRARREFTESRARIEKHLGLEPGTPLAVAYPYGDIGQEEGCNLAHLLNPIRTLLNEASRQYQQGFALDQFGYTCFGDNPLLIRRYEPTWDQEPAALVEEVLANHPVFIARKLRTEIATLMQKPYLAERQIELLRRDGYPERLLRELIAYTINRAPSAIEAQALEEADRQGTSRTRIQPSNFYLAPAYLETQANEQILQQQFELRGGLNLNAMTGLELLFRTGSIEQTLKSNVWYKVQQSETSQSRVVETRTENGVTTTSDVITETTETREVQTNRVDRRKFEADIQEIRAALTLRVGENASVSLNGGQKTLTIRRGREPGATDGSELVGTLSASWKPYRPLQLVAFYDHDLVPSARRLLSYDSFGLKALWNISDEWLFGCDARYWNYEDNNAMVHLLASSFWEILHRQGIWAGLEAATYSMDEDSDYYWAPYWDTRVTGIGRLRRSYLNYYFQFDIRLGFQQEDARPADRQAYLNLLAQANKDGSWHPGDDPKADWDFYMGFDCTYRQRVGGDLDLVGTLNVNFLRDYSEHSFMLGLQYNF